MSLWSSTARNKSAIEVDQQSVKNPWIQLVHQGNATPYMTKEHTNTFSYTTTMEGSGFVVVKNGKDAPSINCSKNDDCKEWEEKRLSTNTDT